MKLSRSKEIKKLDRIFSQYIRQKYADHSGMVRCITCSKVYHWKEIHAGHYVPRGCHLTRFDEHNVHPQCCACNTYRDGEIHEYTLYIENMYGKEVRDELIDLKRRWACGEKWISVPDIRALQEVYKQKLSNL